VLALLLQRCSEIAIAPGLATPEDNGADLPLGELSGVCHQGSVVDQLAADP